MPMLPQPGSDSAALEKQGDQRPTAAEGKRPAGEQVFAEDWWSHARPIFEIHGYFRVRAELFHNFSLGRIDRPSQALWPMPADNNYARINGESYGPALCTADETVEGLGDSDNPANGLFPCKNKTQAGANLRFRLNPELHISDNLRVISQIDLLDNLVLGSTPEGFVNQPGESGYVVRSRSGYTPLGVFDTTQIPPTAGQNSLKDSISVKRAWAEYMTPVGELRFGRMPDHWGLGILHNAGDGFDDDYQSTVDRIMFVTGIKSLDVYVAGAWDFANEGPTSETFENPQAQPYDLAQLDDVDQYVLMLMRRKNEELTKLALAQGKLVLNGGLYLTYRRQLLAADVGPDTAGTGSPGTCDNAFAIGCFPNDAQAVSPRYERRGAEAWIPDLWLQLLYKKFRFEVEAVAIRGSVESIDGDPEPNGSLDYTDAPGGAGWKLRQYGLATELEQKLVEDRLKLQFKFGWASGDGDQVARSGDNRTSVSGVVPGLNGFLAGDETFSTFRFHPNYKVDLILNRNLLTRIQGVYYFRPGVEYDFVRSTNGQRFGGGFNAVWTRASQFVQTPGHKRDLGVELDFSLYFQSKDGALNDDPDKMGGFFTMLQYGVLFPMGALDYQDGEREQIQNNLLNSGAAETSSAQILRWYLGVMF
jgi:uncharacterized protein (TIGR04551 family)